MKNELIISGIDPDSWMTNVNETGNLYISCGLTEDQAIFVQQRVDEIIKEFSSHARQGDSILPLVANVLNEFKNDGQLQFCAIWELAGFVLHQHFRKEYELKLMHEEAKFSCENRIIRLH